MKKIKIRKVKKEDFNSVINLAKQLWDTEKVFSENIQDDYYSKENVQKLLKIQMMRKNTIFLVACIGDEVVGFIEGYILFNNGAYYKDIAYINRIVVDEKNRKIGIGSKLIEEFSIRMKKRGCEYIKLNAFEGNIPAIELYTKKLGFEEYSVMYMKKINK